MNSFEYAAPATLDEATNLLAEEWGKTEILAGGTDLVTSMKQLVTTPTRVVSLKNISALKGIQADAKQLRVGAMTTLRELADHAAIRAHFPSILSAIQGIGSAQMISTGTVGGELCQRPRCWYFRNGHGLLGRDGDTSLVLHGDNRLHAIFGNSGPAYFVSASSLGPAFIALGATLSVTGPKGKTRTIPAAEFFRTPKSDTERETALNPNEILTEISIPLAGLRNATYEVRHRHGLDWPYVTATVAFQERGGLVSNSRVVLGHVAPIPWVAAAAGKALDGRRLEEAVATACGAAAAEGAKPLSRNGYKVQLVKTAVKRAALAAASA